MSKHLPKTYLRLNSLSLPEGTFSERREERLRVGELARVIDEVASLVEEWRLGEAYNPLITAPTEQQVRVVEPLDEGTVDKNVDLC